MIHVARSQGLGGPLDRYLPHLHLAFAEDGITASASLFRVLAL